jgi:hypothetical protein
MDHLLEVKRILGTLEGRNTTQDVHIAALVATAHAMADMAESLNDIRRFLGDIRETAWHLCP